jgi:hypothetical protein
MIEKLGGEFGGYSYWIWLSIGGALLIRALHTKHGSLWSTFKETVTGLFMAYFLTTPVMIVADLPQDAEIGVAFCLGLWGGKLLVLTLEAKSIGDLIKAWRAR